MLIEVVSEPALEQLAGRVIKLAVTVHLACSEISHVRMSLGPVKFSSATDLVSFECSIVDRAIAEDCESFATFLVFFPVTLVFGHHAV